jgi:hypothetical protein
MDQEQVLGLKDILEKGTVKMAGCFIAYMHCVSEREGKGGRVPVSRE